MLVLQPSGAAAQAFAFDVNTYRPWSGYAIPNGEWRSLDFNGDGRADIVHVVAGRDYVHTWASRGNATFNVGTFRPWRGYAMPNGLWLVADLNGDNKDDLVHAVQGRDYVHTWMSKGDGTFNVGTFRPWRGYAIPNGEWRVVDLNGDNRDDIVHVVAGTDYVHTWISRGNGTFRVGTFRPWRGYAMPNGLWLTGDIDGDGDGDLVHAVRGRDYVHTWRSRGNGTFNVGTFRPWRGYAIPNGEWRVLDFNGDGRDDILHIVAGRDYVHTWRSRGNGTFNVGTFRPWRGYAMPNGLWLTGDFNRDGKDDLVHAVNRQDYVHTWMSRGNGTFNVGTFSPWPGYAIPNGIWLTGDHNKDGKMDIVHAVRGRDYVHPWISQLPAPGEFYLEGVEMTQVVQDMDHSVPLVARKGTAIRAYPAFNGSGTRKVKGRLYVRNSSGGSWRLLDSVNEVTVDASRNGDLRAKRENTDMALNFRVPASHLAQGRLTAWFADIRDASTGSRLPCAGCWGAGRTLALGDDNTFRLRVLGMRYTNGSPPATFQPRALDYNLLRSWLRRVYPTGDLRMYAATVNAGLGAPFSCNDVNARLTAIRNADIAGGRDRRTHYYGLTYDDADARSFFMRGCAAGIPGNPNPGTVASGPTGPATWGWDTDGSYGDWYGGHELGHTLGRFHIGSGCGDSSDDPSYPYPNGQISGNDGAFVGFDVGDSGLGIDMEALPGTVWTDVMSYCANQWISDYTYTRMRTRIAAEDNLPAGPTPPSAAVAGAVGMAAAEGPPKIVEGEEQPVAFGAGGETAPGAMVAPAMAPVGEVLPAGEAPAEPPAPAYEQAPDIATAMEAPAEPGARAYAGDLEPPPALEGVAPTVAPAAERTGTRPEGLDERMVTMETAVREGDFLAIAGTANLTRSTGRIVDVRRVDKAVVPTGPVTSSVRIRALDDDGSVIETWEVPFLPESDREEGEDLRGVVDAVVPFPENAVTIALVVNDATADSFSPPRQVGAISGELSAQVAAVTAVDDEAGRVAELDWSGAGRAPTGVTYDVQVSTDDGETWNTLAIGLKDPATTIDLSGLPEKGRLSVRVMANSGFESTVVGSTTIELDGQRE